MAHEHAPRSSRIDGHLQRVEAQLRVDAVAHRPANDGAREQVEDGGELHPALARPHGARF
jgi:hypothetical protein